MNCLYPGLIFNRIELHIYIFQKFPIIKIYKVFQVNRSTECTSNVHFENKKLFIQCAFQKNVISRDYIKILNPTKGIRNHV